MAECHAELQQGASLAELAGGTGGLGTKQAELKGGCAPGRTMPITMAQFILNVVSAVSSVFNVFCKVMKVVLVLTKYNNKVPTVYFKVCLFVPFPVSCLLGGGGGRNQKKILVVC